MLGFAQTHQGFALDPPPFEKGGPKLYYFSTAVTIMVMIFFPERNRTPRLGMENRGEEAYNRIPYVARYEKGEGSYV